jgi:hypothetical protein
MRELLVVLVVVAVQQTLAAQETKVDILQLKVMQVVTDNHQHRVIKLVVVVVVVQVQLALMEHCLWVAQEERVRHHQLLVHR